MNKAILCICMLLTACGGAHQHSPACTAQMNYCMEQCALDPPPSERQDDRHHANRNSRTRCEMMCDKCTEPKATNPTPGPDDPIYSNNSAPPNTTEITPIAPPPPTPRMG